ncbi:MAG: GNAT family N-acetyltransferase [Armatimonadetes bacterium]|nr:GNAT family N-acetyltransferase [Armatimonadota bacterium]
MADIEYRGFDPELDDVVQITEMLHRAYKRLKDMNLLFNATHQPPERTLRRLVLGSSYVAVADGKVVGTVTVCPPKLEEPVETFFDREDVAHFEQFGVDPDFQEHGVGRKLLGLVEEEARQMGAKFIALDTAEPALHLIKMYERWGYRIVDLVDWGGVNYLSVIMAKKL